MLTSRSQGRSFESSRMSKPKSSWTLSRQVTWCITRLAILDTAAAIVLKTIVFMSSHSFFVFLPRASRYFHRSSRGLSKEGVEVWQFFHAVKVSFLVNVFSTKLANILNFMTKIENGRTNYSPLMGCFLRRLLVLRVLFVNREVG